MSSCEGYWYSVIQLFNYMDSVCMILKTIIYWNLFEMPLPVVITFDNKPLPHT